MDLQKAKNIFFSTLRWLLKEWVKALLGAIAIIFLGFLAWAFRSYITDWLTSKHCLEMYGWTWIAALLAIVSAPILCFWLVTRDSDLLSNEQDIEIILRDWWFDQSMIQKDSSLPESPLSQPIYFSSIDAELKLKKGSAKKYLPDIVKNDSQFIIASTGKDVIRFGEIIDNRAAINYWRQWRKSDQKDKNANQ